MKTLGLTALVTLIALTFSFAAEPAIAAESLHTGQWTKKTQKAAGTWTITEEDGKRYFELSADFKTKKAPDLAIYFSTKTVRDLKNKNAEDGAVKVAQLEKIKGAQRYEIPASVELDEYVSVIIHCKKYTKLWCAAALSSDSAGLTTS